MTPVVGINTRLYFQLCFTIIIVMHDKLITGRSIIFPLGGVKKTDKADCLYFGSVLIPSTFFGHLAAFVPKTTTHSLFDFEFHLLTHPARRNFRFFLLAKSSRYWQLSPQSTIVDRALNSPLISDRQIPILQWLIH